MADTAPTPVPPHAKGAPLVGDTLAFIKDPQSHLAKRYKELGDIFTHTVFGQKFLQVGSPSAVRKLLAAEHNLVEAYTPPTFDLMLGPGSLPASQGERHLRMRRVLTPAFAPKTVATYLPRIVAIAQECVDRWLQLGSFTAQHEVNRFTFQVAVEIILGFDESWLADDKLKAAREAFQDWTLALFSVAPLFTRFVPGTTLYKGVKAREMLMEAIEENLRKLQDLPDNASSAEKAGRTANIAHKLANQKDENGETLSIQELKDLSLNVLFAGHETTTKTLLLLLQRLKQHPAALASLRVEQHKVIAEHGEELSVEAVKAMGYAEACSKEMLRMVPIVGAVLRRALKDFEVDGLRIKKKENHVIWLSIGRVTKEVDERWAANERWPAAEFHPERWLSEQGQEAGQWMPFGGGLRVCPGMHLALAEMKVLLAVLARRCDWEVNLEEPIQPFPIPTPANGLPMRMWAVGAQPPSNEPAA